MADSNDRTPSGTDSIGIITLLGLASLITRAGSKPTLGQSPELAEFCGASELWILDLTDNPTGAYKNGTLTNQGLTMYFVR